MSIEKRLNEDMKEAMKAKDSDRLGAIRAVKSAFLLEKTSGSGLDEISDELAIKIIQKQIKQRKDSAEIYKTQNRQDLYDKEMAEVKALEIYLPAQMSEAEIESALKGIIAQTGATSQKDMGKVMGVASKQLAGKADGKIIAAKVKELLS